jgi:hypothetical protein
MDTARNGTLGEDILLALCMLAGAALYTSVGHAGASAYIALMALFGLPTAVMRPTALTLNILVAAFTSFRFVKAGQFRWRSLWPFVVTAIPMAYVGGSIHLPTTVYRPLLGVVLLLAAARLLWPQEVKADRPWSDPPIIVALLCGAVIGLLSGLTGTGGGIFLSPLLLFLSWSPVRMASGVAAVFILFNSAAGLLGNIASVQSLPPQLPLFAGAVLIGAAIGTTLGIKVAPAIILRLLGVVLIVAGLKLLGAY